MRYAYCLVPLAFATPVLATPVFATPVLAETCTVPDGAGEASVEAQLVIEDNAGDGDISVVAHVDAEDWRELCVFDPTGALLLRLLPSGGLARMGVAKASFESREPTYAQMDYAAMKAAWSEGQYSVRAVGPDGAVLTGEAMFTTVLPSAPVILTPITVPEPDGDVPVVPMADLAVHWLPVTTSQDGRPLVVTGYAVSVVKENHDDPNGASRPDMEVHLGPDATSWIVPAAFFDPASLYELEVFVTESSGNQTIGGASFFATQ